MKVGDIREKLLHIGIIGKDRHKEKREQQCVYVCVHVCVFLRETKRKIELE